MTSWSKRPARPTRIRPVSVLYHTLRAAETNTRYIADAEERGDREVVDFLRNVQQSDREIADQAKRLLRGRLDRLPRRPVLVSASRAGATAARAGLDRRDPLWPGQPALLAAIALGSRCRPH